MTSAAMQAIFDEYGEKICAISLDNGRVIYIGYNQKDWSGKPIPDGEARGVTLKDIEFITYGDVEFMKITQKLQSQGMKVLEKISLHPLDNIQCIQICNTDGYLLDPLMIN